MLDPHSKSTMASGHDDAGKRGDFEYLESNMIDKHVDEDGSILCSNMHYKDI